MTTRACVRLQVSRKSLRTRRFFMPSYWYSWTRGSIMEWQLNTRFVRCIVTIILLLFSRVNYICVHLCTYIYVYYTSGSRDTIIIYFICTIIIYLLSSSLLLSFLLFLFFFQRPLQNNITMVGLHYHNFMRVRHTPSHLFLHIHTCINVIMYTRERVRASPIALIQTSVPVYVYKPFQNDKCILCTFYLFVYFYFLFFCSCYPSVCPWNKNLKSVLDTFSLRQYVHTTILVSMRQ